MSAFPLQKIPIYKKNVIFNNPEKSQPSWKSLNPYTWKNLNLSKNPSPPLKIF